MAKKPKTLYEKIEILIDTNRYTKVDMLEKLNIFLLFEQLTKEEYGELIKLMEEISEVK